MNFRGASDTLLLVTDITNAQAFVRRTREMRIRFCGSKPSTSSICCIAKPGRGVCFIWNNLHSMRNDNRVLKDAAVSGSENAYNSFLARDTTLDELIARGSRFVTALDLRALSLLAHRLIRKLELIDPHCYPGFDQAVHATVLVLRSPQAQAAIDPLPGHLAEVGFAAYYFLKESGLIPDRTPGIGFADDFAIFKQVFARNRLDIDIVIYKSW